MPRFSVLFIFYFAFSLGDRSLGTKANGIDPFRASSPLIGRARSARVTHYLHLITREIIFARMLV